MSDEQGRPCGRRRRRCRRRARRCRRRTTTPSHRANILFSVSVLPPMPEQRIVPGAPPPTTPQKAQRKKRRAKNVEDDAPKDPVPQELQEPLDVPDDDSKPNFILDLLSKRKRLATKKIACPLPSIFLRCSFFCQNRCCAYATTDPEKLDEDQKRTIVQRPEHEAVQKELALIYTAVEVILPLTPL